MSEAIGLVSGLTALVTLSLQASKSLYATIDSFKTHPKNIRELKNELHEIGSVLGVLQGTVSADTYAAFELLDIPLRRCASACTGFKEILLAHSGQSKGSRPDFRDWAKLRYLGGDVNGFRERIAGYKSTIAVALGGARLRVSTVSLSVLRDYRTLVRNTATDLEVQLHEVDDRLKSIPSPSAKRTESTSEHMVIQEEKDSYMKCLDICEQVSQCIEQYHKSLVENAAKGSSAAVQVNDGGGGGGGGRGGVRSHQVTVDAFRECQQVLGSTQSELSSHLGLLRDRLDRLDSTTAASQNIEAADKRVIREELESIQQCLRICDDAAEGVEQRRVNVAEDMSIGEDGQQIFVSTIGDLISARKITAGPRSFQCFGQMSEECLQHISRGRGLVSVDGLAKSQPADNDGFESHYGAGRPLKTWNSKG